jgi:hypothetical protein
MIKKCSISGCDKVHEAKGFCNAHYLRLRNNKEMNNPIRKFHILKDINNMKSYMEKNREIKQVVNGMSPCWEWTRSRHRKGYGIVSADGKDHKAHRISMHIYKGFKLKSKLLICHHCDNPPCFNPEHLYAGTMKENYADMVKRGRENHARGSNHGDAKLNEYIVKRIRLMRGFGTSYTETGRLVGISKTNARRICLRLIWKHI